MRDLQLDQMDGKRSAIFYTNLLAGCGPGCEYEHWVVFLAEPETRQEEIPV